MSLEGVKEPERRVAALYVDPNGVYAGLPGVDVWDEARDASTSPTATATATAGWTHGVIALVAAVTCGRKEMTATTKTASAAVARTWGSHRRPRRSSAMCCSASPGQATGCPTHLCQPCGFPPTMVALGVW